MVSVDVKHHVYLLYMDTAGAKGAKTGGGPLFQKRMLVWVRIWVYIRTRLVSQIQTQEKERCLMRPKQHANFRGNPRYQGTKRHLNNI